MSRQKQALVTALNTAIEYANEMGPQLAEDFRQLLGVQILDEEGTPIPLIARLLDPLHLTSSVQVYPSLTSDALSLIVKIRLEVKGKKNLFVHQTVAVQVGEIQDDILVSLTPLTPRRCDYTVDEIKNESFNSTV